MLGDGYQVRNFGVIGATLLRNGEKPYYKTQPFTDALKFAPDVVVLMLGANDAKPQNWGPHKGEFEADYRWLVKQLQGTNPNQKMFLCRPAWVAYGGRYGITDAVLLLEIPIIDAIAASVHATEVDMHAALQGHAMLLPDTVHPSKAGAELLARAAYKAITGNDFHGEVPTPAPTPTPKPSPATLQPSPSE
jgi:sialate O-acetylesterase